MATTISGVPEDTIDAIYEAAFVPELWPRLLANLSQLSGSVGGALLATGDRHPPRWAASEIVAPAMRAYISSDAWKDNKRPEQIMASGHTGFLRDIDLWSAEELQRYRDSDQRTHYGLGWQLGSIIPMPTGEIVIFTFDRRLEDGPHDISMRDMADALRPHLARAGLLAARLGLERARTTVETLATIDLPAAVLTANGNVLVANDLLQNLKSLFVSTANGGIAVANAAANAQLRQAIADYNRRDPVVRSVPIPASAEAGPLVIHLLPVRGAAHDIFSGGEILLAATPVSTDAAVPSLTVLHGLFDLSPAEARLAAALAAGHPLKAVAEANGIQFSTARSYLENIFRKTNTHQQSQLVALLQSTRPIDRG